MASIKKVKPTTTTTKKYGSSKTDNKKQKRCPNCGKFMK